MTADLSTVKYKREAVPVIADEQKLKTYFSDELQRVENTLNNHELIVQSVSSEVDGNLASFNSQISAQASATSAVVSSVSSLTATVGNNTAAISNEQTARANADSALATDITNLTATVASGDSTNAAAITNEQTARANADSAIATDITNLTATVASGDSTNAAAIVSEATARANADSALATDITNLTATVTSGDSTNAAAISSEAAARANADSAIATDITNLTATVTSGDSTNAAAIVSEATARANADSANATAITNLTSTVGSNTSAVAIAAQAAATAQGAVNAKFGVTLDSNGYVSGFESTNNGTTAIFQIAADKFSIRTPNTDSIPFQVDGNVVRMQNVEIGTGVIADNAVSDTHLTTVAQADVVGTSSAFTEIASLTFTPTSASEILFQGNFMTAALNSSNGFNNFGRADFRVRLELTVGGTTTVIKETGTFLIGLFLHGATTILKEHTSSATTAHTLKLKVRNVNFESSTNKLRCLGITLGATVLYK